MWSHTRVEGCLEVSDLCAYSAALSRFLSTFHIVSVRTAALLRSSLNDCAASGTWPADRCVAGVDQARKNGLAPAAQEVRALALALVPAVWMQEGRPLKSGGLEFLATCAAPPSASWVRCV